MATVNIEELIIDLSFDITSAFEEFPVPLNSLYKFERNLGALKTKLEDCGKFLQNFICLSAQLQHVESEQIIIPYISRKRDEIKEIFWTFNALAFSTKNYVSKLNNEVYINAINNTIIIFLKTYLQLVKILKKEWKKMGDDIKRLLENYENQLKNIPIDNTLSFSIELGFDGLCEVPKDAQGSAFNDQYRVWFQRYREQERKKS